MPFVDVCVVGVRNGDGGGSGEGDDDCVDGSVNVSDDGQSWSRLFG